MEWLNPAGLWAWLGIPVVIVLYILRRKATRHEVPSLLLWQKTETAKEALKPFQRLRKQWLLLLQLLLVGFLAFALLRPASLGGMHGETVFIFDISASMQTQLGGESRLQEAVEEALVWVDGMQEGDALSILTAGQTVEQVLTRSTDKQKMRTALRRLVAENGVADVAGAVSLALAMRRDLPELSIVLYSDERTDSQEGIAFHGVGRGAENRGVLSVRCSPQEGGLLVFARIANYGPACDVKLECYADGALCDIRTLSLPPNEQKSVQMNAPENAQIVWVEIKTPDALAVDNTYEWVQQAPSEHEVLLVSDGNVFLEKALALREDVTVYKTNAKDAVSMEGYDLYVLDGTCPEPLPSTGSILAFAPNQSLGGMALGNPASSAGTLRAGMGNGVDAITQNLQLTELALESYRPISGGQSMITLGEDCLLALNAEAGRRFAVLGFDLHQSNLSMKADFPILMQNLFDYLLPSTVTTMESAICGQTIPVAPDERAESSEVVAPSGVHYPVVGGAFTHTQEVGVYTLLEHFADGTDRVTPFALHSAPSESDVRTVAAASPEDAAAQRRFGTGMEWTVYALIAFLALLIVEWEVSRRGS